MALDPEVSGGVGIDVKPGDAEIAAGAAAGFTFGQPLPKGATADTLITAADTDEKIKDLARMTIDNGLAQMDQEAPEGMRFGMRTTGHDMTKGETSFFATEEELRAHAAKLAEETKNGGEMSYSVSVAEYGNDGKIKDSNIVFGEQSTYEGLQQVGSGSGPVMSQMTGLNGSAWEQAEARLALWNGMSEADKNRVMNANLAGAGVTGDHLLATGGNVDAALQASKDGQLDKLLVDAGEKNLAASQHADAAVGAGASPAPEVAAASGMPAIPPGTVPSGISGGTDVAEGPIAPPPTPAGAPALAAPARAM